MSQQFLSLGERIVLAARMATERHLEVLSESDSDFREDCDPPDVDAQDVNAGQ